MGHLPYPVDMLRHYLVNRDAITEVIELDRVVTDVQPPDVTSTFLRIRSLTTTPLGVGNVARVPFLQCDAVTPDGDNAHNLVWDLCELVIDELTYARNVQYSETVSYTARVTDGPIPEPDRSRGDATTLRRALIRVELRAHAL